MEAVLNCAEIRTRAELHDALSAILPLPEWYGRNLDALHDCLTEPVGDLRLTVRDPELLRERLGDYGERFFLVLRDCAAQNPTFHAEFLPNAVR